MSFSLAFALSVPLAEVYIRLLEVQFSLLSLPHRGG